MTSYFHLPSAQRRMQQIVDQFNAAEELRIAFEPAETKRSMRVAERPARYGIKRLAKRGK